MRSRLLVVVLCGLVLASLTALVGWSRGDDLRMLWWDWRARQAIGPLESKQIGGCGEASWALGTKALVQDLDLGCSEPEWIALGLGSKARNPLRRRWMLDRVGGLSARAQTRALVALWKAEELNEVLAPAGFETLGPEGQQEVLRLLDERWLPSPPAGPGLMDRVLLRRFASGQVDPHDAAAAAERWLVDPGGMSAEEVSERLLVGLELDAQRLVAWVSALADGEPVPELPVGWSRVLRQSDDVCDEVASGGCVAVMAGLARESQRWEMEGWQAWELELAEPPAEAALLVPVWAVRWPDERGRLAAAERFAGYQSWVSASSDPAEWNRRAEWASQRAHGLGASDPWRAAAALLALAERGGIVLALEEVEGGPRRVTVGSALDPIVPEALIRRLIDDIEATVL